MLNGILSDTEILSAVLKGDIIVEPFDRKHLNPVSYDLTLGDEVGVYTDWVEHDEELETRRDIAAKAGFPLPSRDGSDLYPRASVLDVSKEPHFKKWKIDAKRGWLLKPGIGYLMHTREVIHTKTYVPILDGKSSLGRLFMQVHATAGFGDPNFNGQFTLEITVQHGLRVFPGMRVAQIRFQTIAGVVTNPYDGSYKGDDARGPVASKFWKKFP